MPLVFGGMMFFFPAGLVLYWVVNNVLSIAQQQYITNKIAKEAAAKKRGYELRVSNTTKELKNTAEIRSNRRDIARIKQAIAEKQNQATKA